MAGRPSRRFIAWVVSGGLVLGACGSRSDFDAMDAAGGRNPAGVGGAVGSAGSGGGAGAAAGGFAGGAAGGGGTLDGGPIPPDATPALDAMVPPDAARDAALDAPVDTGPDSVADGPVDAPPNAVVDAPPDADAGLGPSPGCGTVGPPSGNLVFSVAGSDADYILSIPDTYDETVPYPLGFAFHGRNLTGQNCHDNACAGFQWAMKDDAILVYPTSLGGTGWEGPSELELNVQFFTELLDYLEGTYCIDRGRVFAAGTSSGATFANVLGCRFGDRLLAVAPVAGHLPETQGCVGRVAALVIHGVDDWHVPFSSGEQARDFHLTRNGCSSVSTPPVSELHARVVANRESHECAEYAGCDAGYPVVWCEHSEGGYDGSTHGWPLFGGDRIWEFVQSLGTTAP